MKLNIFLIFILLSYSAKTQITIIDSLINSTNLRKDDTIKVLNQILLSNKFRTITMDYGLSKQYSQKAEILSEKILFKRGLMMSYIARGYAERDMGNRNECTKYLSKAIHLFEVSNELKNNPNLYNNYISICTALSENYTHLLDFKNAEKFAFHSLRWAETHNLDKGLSWNTIAYIFYRQKNIDEAINYSQKALKEFMSRNNFEAAARANAFLASYAYEKGNYKKSIEFYKEALNLYEKVGSAYGKRIALYNLASVYCKIKDYENAEQYAIEAQQITGKEDQIGTFFICQLRAELNLFKKNYDESIKLSFEALEIAKKQKSIKDLHSVHMILSDAYLQKGDTSLAFTYFKLMKENQDSMYSIELAKNTSDLLKKYESEKKEERIKFLNKENQLKKVKLIQEQLLRQSLSKTNKLQLIEIQQSEEIRAGLERENQLKKNELKKEEALIYSLTEKTNLMSDVISKEKTIKILLFSFLLILIILGSIILKDSLQLKEKNKTILKQKEGIEHLNMELQHRVKNNLAIIISILRMQARTIEDERAIEALKISESRIQAIYQIHDMLFKNEDSENINLTEFLENIIKNIQFQIGDQFIDVSFNSIQKEILFLKPAKVVPLALILNELMTNSYKHGLKKNKVKIDINLEIQEKEYHLKYSDNGPGFDEMLFENTGKSIGLKLIKLFTIKLNGKLEFKTKPFTQFYFIIKN